MNNIEQVLKTYYGYDEFRPLQKDIIMNAIGGGDAYGWRQVAMLSDGGADDEWDGGYRVSVDLLDERSGGRLADERHSCGGIEQQ